MAGSVSLSDWLGSNKLKCVPHQESEVIFLNGDYRIGSGHIADTEPTLKTKRNR